VVQKAPFLGNTDTRFPHHAEGDFVVKTVKPEGAVAPSHRYSGGLEAFETEEF
jgi:hypothetical protein